MRRQSALIEERHSIRTTLSHTNRTDISPYPITPMPLIWTDEDDIVQRRHHKPWMLSDEQADGSIYVEQIPEPEDRDGERAELYYTATDGFWYEYEVIEDDE